MFLSFSASQYFTFSILYNVLCSMSLHAYCHCNVCIAACVANKLLHSALSMMSGVGTLGLHPIGCGWMNLIHGMSLVDRSSCNILAAFKTNGLCVIIWDVSKIWVLRSRDPYTWMGPGWS